MIRSLVIEMYSVAPVCFSTAYCEGESVTDDLITFGECCLELSGISFASFGQCLLCPKSGTNVCTKFAIHMYTVHT